jgi:hypothetical protein
MANWFERAKRELSNVAHHSTANTDERNLTAVTAVSERNELKNSEGAHGMDPVVADIRDQGRHPADYVPSACWNCGAIMTKTRDIHGKPWWACWACAKTA